ncbi:MAG TPA: hypothetical protein VFB61_03105 [Gemmatimonadales bacterium]|nr:hypothetical protein [Gemmatimonadales bacterium]
MIRRNLLMASVIIAAVVTTACSDTTAPKALASRGLSATSFPRSGTLHVEKECSAYTGHAGDICTFTSSTLKEIPVGSRIIYLVDAVFPSFDGDVRVDPPGPGNNTAHGHCVVRLDLGTGECSFSGGTGKFTWFHASVAVSPLGGPDFAWNGTYNFSPRD